MRLDDFEQLVRRMAGEIPGEFLEGIADISVSPRIVPHPEQPGVWTLGECIPLPSTDSDPRSLQSRIVLYHGSFQALARDTDGFDWEEETWETLAHEVRHQVEWRASATDLEKFDLAAESNFARQAGQPFDPQFYRGGIRRPDGAFDVDGDVFFERVDSSVPRRVTLRWAGIDYRVEPPVESTLPAFLLVEGVRNPPPGDLVLVLRGKTRLGNLFRRNPVFTAAVGAVPESDYFPEAESS